MTHDNADLSLFLESVVEVVGKTLCRRAHGVYVHSVGAGTHDAAETACSEFEVFVERFYKVGLVVGVKHSLHLRPCIGIV